MDGEQAFRARELKVGDKVGSLVMLSTFMDGPGRRKWNVKCETCGKERAVRIDHLCRYFGRECHCEPHSKTHGLSKVREYGIWKMMVSRCHNPNAHNYRSYGEKGRFVCDGWRNSVEAFIADMGPAPSKKHTLDRVDSKGGYTCGKCEHCKAEGLLFNCRWATKDVQCRNATNNLYYTHNGQTLILKDWARIRGIGYLTLYSRLKRGWDFATAIETPPLKEWSRGRKGASYCADRKALPG